MEIDEGLIKRRSKLDSTRMPRMDLQQLLRCRDKKELEDIFVIVLNVVRKACHTLGHYPEKMELDDLGQRIMLLLMKNDCKTLRSFNHESSQETWLFAITRRYIAKHLREQKNFVSLETLPVDSFITQPDQEKGLISEERMKRLLKAICKLTNRERELFHLWYQGIQPTEIAQSMRISKESVYKMRSELVKKLRGLLEEEGKNVLAKKRS
jgi:RNA polymerase sigma factor (sigma-70 family)